MPLLCFTLSEGGVRILYDMLTCLNKFSETVALEARDDSFFLSTFNSTKSAYARISLEPDQFFSKYAYMGNKERFYCIMAIHALLPVFAKRTPPGISLEDSAIERCDVTIEDEIGKHSRFIARIIKRNGIGATHRLPFEPAPPIHAKFDQDAACNTWKGSARILRQLVDHFSPGTELLDINLDASSSDPGNPFVVFRCYTEKKVSGDQVLKKPLHTSISMAVDEFDEMDVEENLHITITVKDFKSIVQHAASLKTNITARYSTPSQPISLTYPGDGFSCKFLLTTVGERTGDGRRKKKGTQNDVKPAKPSLETASRTASMARSYIAQRPLENSERSATEAAASLTQPSAPKESFNALNPPMMTRAAPVASIASDSRSRSWLNLRPDNLRPPQRTTADNDSLFVTQDEEDDQQWAPLNDDEEQTDDTVGWGQTSFGPNAHFSASVNMNRLSGPNESDQDSSSRGDMSFGIEPTQRLSDVRKFGLFGS